MAHHSESIAALFERPKLLCLNQSLIAGNVSCHVNVYKAHLHAMLLYQLKTNRRKKGKLPFGTPWALD